MGVLDRIRNRGRISDPGEALEEARIEEEGRKRLRDAKEEARIQQVFGKLAAEQGIVVKGRESTEETSDRKKATGKGGSPVNPNIVVESELKQKETDWTTVLIILLAYAIWIFDLSSYYGGRYEGYNFTKLLLLNTNWAAVLTSGVVTFFLVWNGFQNLFNRDSGFVWSLVGVAILNSSFTYFIYEKTFSVPYLNYALLILAGTGIFLYLRHQGYNFSGSEEVAYMIMVFTFSFFWINWSWTAKIKAIIHVAFILLFCLFYLQPKPGTNKTGIYYLTTIFFLADFFLYSINIEGYPAFAYFPILVLITTYYCDMFTESKFARFNMFILVGIIFFILIYANPTPAYGGDDLEEKNPSDRSLISFMGNIGTGISNFIDKLKNVGVSQIDYATGGQYKATVEKNQFEPLGVYLERVRVAQPKFYTDEPVTLWGTLKSRTLSDPVIASFTCYRYGQDNKRIEIDKTETDPAKKDELIPEKPFAIYSFEEKDVECTFRNKFQNQGSNTITLSAVYNFETSAYQKAYFMDRERYRAMIRENLDPLKEFGIKERKPDTIYTNGPVEIIIGIQNPVTVSDEKDDVKPPLSIELKNRNKITDKQGKAVGQWEGNIKKLTELIVVLPKGITIDNPDRCTPVKFDKIEIDTLDKLNSYCKGSCLDAINSVCSQRCSDFFIEEEKKKKCIEETCDTTKNEISESLKRCDEECKNLFRGESEKMEYQGYKIDIKDLEPKYKEVFKDKDRNQMLQCRLTPTKEVLENVPLTTKFIRVKARYDYVLEKSFGVRIDSIPAQVLPQGAEETIKSTIEQIKTKEGIDLPIYTVKGLISLESDGRHCCKEKGKNRGRLCKADDAKVTCEPDEIITSYDGSSIGIMQINTKDSKGSQNKARNERLQKELCEGQTIYNRDCNIKVGLAILKENSISFANGINKEKLKKSCSDKWDVDGVKLQDLYGGYTGLNAALRAYNGWGCNVEKIEATCRSYGCNTDVKCKNCVRGTVFYVRKVEEIGNLIRQGRIRDPFPELAEYVRSEEAGDEG